MKKVSTTLQTTLIKVLFSLFFCIFLGQQINAQTTQQLLVNNGFETGTSPWSATNNVFRFNIQPYSGNWYMALANADGSSGNNIFGNLTQNFSVPSNATSLKISWYQKITTSEVTNAEFDFMRIRVIRNGVYEQVYSQSNINFSSGYVYRETVISNNVNTITGLNFYMVNDMNYPTTFRVDEIYVTATTPNVVTYNVATNATPTNGGSVSGGGVYNSGSMCTLTAYTNPNYTFSSFNENGITLSTNPSYSFAVNANRSITASFNTNTATNFTITTNANPSNGGNTSGGGVYSSGSQRTISASPNSGYNFIEWRKNNVQVSTNANYTFTVTANETYEAIFSQNNPNSYQITTTATPSNGGSTSGGGNIVAGNSASIAALANPNFVFSRWTKNGTLFSYNANYTFTPTSSANYIAEFTANNSSLYSIATSTTPTLGGSVNGGGQFAYNTSITLNAVANSGYAFESFSTNGVIVSTNQNYTFNVVGNMNVIANFVLQTSKFKLPFPIGKSIVCTQGNNTSSSHNGTAKYAFDFSMPIGSTVTAMRGGVVANIVETNDNGNCPYVNGACDASCRNSYNYVSIKHDDGTYALYIHLDKNGVLVNSGQVITQGQVIAKSGNSGCSSGPHLHVMLTNTSYYSQSIPMRFCDVSTNNGVPTGGNTYQSKQCSTGGVPSNSISNTIQISPNPNNGTFTINYFSDKNEEASICLYNSKGVKISCKTESVFSGNNSINFSVTNLTAGIYFVSIRTATFKKAVPVIIN
jgi:murein DD-endopeptidase MepM/ murein hydrolase activator NlpD